MIRLSVLFATLALASAADAQPVRAGATLDGIAAVVGNQVVLKSEVEGAAQQLAQGQPVTDQIWSRTLDQLINQRVLVVQAERDTTLSVTEDQITQQVDARVAQIAAQVGGETQLATYFGKPIEEIKASLRQDMRGEILAQQFRGRRMRDVVISPDEVQAWYDRIPEAELPIVPELVRVAHIVVVPEPSPAARDAARGAVAAYRDSILAGQATIEALAGRHSDDGGSAQNGGRYDDFSIGDLVPEFGTVAGQLEPGALSSVFETQFGFHVMRLNSRVGDRVSFNHILVSIDAEGSEAEGAIAELTALRDSVVTMNVPFEAVARRNSEDPYSAPRGGFVADPRTGERDLRLDGLGGSWGTTIASLEIGEISEPAPVQLLDGSDAYHIVLLQRRTPEHRLSVTQDYQLLSQYALDEKRQRVLESWVNRLRGEVYVDVRSERYQPLGA